MASKGQKKGFRHSEETKQRISQTMKNKSPLPQIFKKGCTPPPHAFKKGHIPWNKGKKFPEMGAARMGENNPNWRGGTKESQGYIFILNPSHPRALNGYVKRAILVMEKKIGRHLTKQEIVHHKNGNTKDDRIANLHLCKNRSEHLKIHRNS